MYCRNCGNSMDPNAVICVRCGCSKGTGTSFCPNCGAATVATAVACTACGAALPGNAASGSKSKLLAGLMGIFFGGFGVHNFILGYTGKAVAQLLITVLSCGMLSPISAIWGLVEGIMILTGSISQDAKGIPLSD